MLWCPINIKSTCIPWLAENVGKKTFFALKKLWSEKVLWEAVGGFTWIEHTVFSLFKECWPSSFGSFVKKKKRLSRGASKALEMYFLSLLWSQIRSNKLQSNRKVIVLLSQTNRTGKALKFSSHSVISVHCLKADQLKHSLHLSDREGDKVGDDSLQEAEKAVLHGCIGCCSLRASVISSDQQPLPVVVNGNTINSSHNNRYGH